SSSPDPGGRHDSLAGMACVGDRRLDRHDHYRLAACDGCRFSAYRRFRLGAGGAAEPAPRHRSALVLSLGPDEAEATPFLGHVCYRPCALGQGSLRLEPEWNDCAAAPLRIRRRTPPDHDSECFAGDTRITAWHDAVDLVQHPA